MQDNVVFLIVEEDLKDEVDKEAVADLLAQHCIKEGWLKEVEVFEEPKETLWDKRKPYIVSGECGGFEYLEEDIKEALKAYRDWVYEKLDPGLLEYDETTAEEIFGEKMLK